MTVVGLLPHVTYQTTIIIIIIITTIIIVIGLLVHMSNARVYNKINSRKEKYQEFTQT